MPDNYLSETYTVDRYTSIRRLREDGWTTIKLSWWPPNEDECAMLLLKSRNSHDSVTYDTTFQFEDITYPAPEGLPYGSDNVKWFNSKRPMLVDRNNSIGFTYKNGDNVVNVEWVPPKEDQPAKLLIEIDNEGTRESYEYHLVDVIDIQD